jgi:ribosomal protein L11 methyltransferase
MYYTRLQVTCDQEFSEILMAETGEAGFETFMETDNGFEAYVEEDRYDKDQLEQIRKKYKDLTPVDFHYDKVEKENWNEKWEQSYQPIIVDDLCLIRAHFHKPERSYPYEIIITPKMSFGTGHHQTTYLMIKGQLKIDHRERRVMDAGCGTAILSVMASKRGAKEIEAFDIDEWSVINGQENVEINGCRNIHLQQGKITEVKLQGLFDIILANINKNVLLSEMSLYEKYLQPGGLLLLSGFYSHDVADLMACASPLHLKEVWREERETWSSLLLQKK